MSLEPIWQPSQAPRTSSARGPVIDLTPIEFFSDDDYPVIEDLEDHENDQ